jgi:hypothetical protein
MDGRQIRELFKKHDVEVSRDDLWDVNGKPVILHAALERLSAALELEWDMPTVVKAESEEVVLICRAKRKDGKAEWSFGEVKIVREGVLGGNYKVTGKQPGYPYAMAEKRGKDRVIIKLAGLHGAYSEEEADDFAQRNQGSNARRDDKAPAANERAAGNATAEPNFPPREEPPASGPADSAPVDGPVVDTSTSQVPSDSAPPPEPEKTPEELVAIMIEAVGKLPTKAKIVAWMSNKKVLATFNRLGDELTEKVKQVGRERMEAIKQAELAKRAQADAAADAAVTDS